ncbi:MAG: methionyl-tRNA formyltransferase [Gammaproteobacteria bacterium]
MLKIIYAGTPEFAVPALETLLQSRHQLVAVYTQPDRPAGRGQKIKASPVKTCALSQNIPVYQPESLGNPAEIERLAGFQADLMVVAAYGLLLPPQLLELPRLGCINIHASLLPRWRGAAPIQRAIQAGDKKTGITIMQMDEGLDTGDMLIFESLPIHPDWNSAELHDRLKLLGAQLLIEAVDKLDSGQLVSIHQDHERSTYAARLSKQEAEIDWNKDADTLHREIRAFVPWPVSCTHLDNTNIRIWAAQLDTSHSPQAPGEIVGHNRDGIFVSCRDSVLQITRFQLAGKRQSSAAQLLNSKNLTGLRFASHGRGE